MVQQQQQSPLSTPPAPNGDSRRATLGIPAYSTQPALQGDAFKELVNKLAWALGSTYRLPYRNQRLAVRVLALELAKGVMVEHGYPAHIRKD